MWRPGFLATQPGSRVVSDTARAVARRGCLQWLDADGLKGGANAVWIRRGQLAGPSPEERPETRDAARLGAGKALLLLAPFGAPLPHFEGERK